MSSINCCFVFSHSGMALWIRVPPILDFWDRYRFWYIFFFSETYGDFKELANTVHQTPNVVEATNKPGLFGKLEDIQCRWDISLFLLLMSVIRGTLMQGLCFLHMDAHTHTGFVYFSTGCLYVKKLWQNTWTPSVWPSPDFTSSPQLIYWTSCLMGPTHTRWIH